MKKILLILTLSSISSVPSLRAQPANSPAKSTGDYASDVDVVIEAEGNALEQARQMLASGENLRDKPALETAVKEMEHARTALEAARKSPDKLPAAIAAEQSAYQALLKATPREYRMSRSRSRNQKGGGSGQPSQQELNQLDMTKEENRYETERQATADQTPQQREQSETADRLKQLARRQQDMNDRLRDLQTALQEARTEQEREDIQRQLKRLRDEERQMLADVDELRQKMEQSPDASKQAEARQQLEQTRNDVQKAAQELENKSVSEALAAGARAEQNLQNLRENLRQQTSSQFAKQMRQLRNEAHDLANQEDKIAHDLDGLNNSGEKKLDDASQRKALSEQLARQQNALTNLLGEMRTITEQAETTEPLLSKQLYDIVRRADQAHADNQLDISAQLVDRGFLPQASQAERTAGKNIDELRQGVDRAADSVLGSEADALRYAQKELEDLATQVANELATGTNSPASAAGQNASNGGQARTNSMARAGSNKGNGRADTNAVASAESTSGGAESQSGGEQQSAQNQQKSEREGQNGSGKNQPGSSQSQQSKNPSNGQGAASAQGQASAGNNQQGSNSGQQSGNASEAQDGAAADDQVGAQAGGDPSGKERLRQIAQQIGGSRGGSYGGSRGGLGSDGPITGSNYVDWSERMRDVEQAVDSQDVRNQLATVRERVGAYRRAFRENGQPPSKEDLQNKVLTPLTMARDWVGQELSRAQNDRSLVPLDRDPVQEKYSELVRKYYEKLGSPQ
ncbi:MAG: hypothetical protein JWQ04_335 [Pedosphaera sp.]|nr:hypothetical protein [Pedosphaera sp.]